MALVTQLPEEEAAFPMMPYPNNDTQGNITFPLVGNMTPGRPGPRPPDLSHIKYITLTSYLAIFIFGLVGNTLVLYVIARFTKVRQRSVANYYIWNLALADELHIFTLPWYCVASYMSNWLFGDVMCSLSMVIRECNKFASVFTLVALTIDRYLATYHNLGRFRTIRVGKVVCLVIWVCCLVSCTPYWMYAYTVTMRDGSKSCKMNWPKSSELYIRTAWTYTQFVIGYLLPLCVIILFNVLLLNRLRGMVRPGAGEKRSRNNSSMTKTVLTVVIIFLVCQAPYYVMEIINLWIIQRIMKYQIMPSTVERLLVVHFNMVAQILVYVSSSCNPIIYGVFNRNFRNLYKEVLCCGYFSEERVRQRKTDYKQVPRRPQESNATCCTTIELSQRSPRPASNGRVALVQTANTCADTRADVAGSHSASPKHSSHSM